MIKMLRRIDGWRFELPLAALLALSAAFLLLAMPVRLIAGLPGVLRLGGLMQPVVAAVAALAAGLAALALIAAGGAAFPASRPEPDTIDDDAAPESELAPDFTPEPVRPVEEIVAPAIPESPIRMRRADAHPDAPPRAPILAMRDLGAPFMDVAPEPAPGTIAIFDAEFLELPESAPATHTVADAEPAAPARPERESVADMMARLDAGMRRREAPMVPPRDAGPALRDALAELNRLASRRG